MCSPMLLGERIRHWLFLGLGDLRHVYQLSLFVIPDRFGFFPDEEGPALF